MLQKLLAEIQKGGTLEPHQLAESLNTTPEMVLSMLDHLARLGLLREKLACATTQCKGCPLQNSCQQPSNTPPKMWSFTQPAKND